MNGPSGNTISNTVPLVHSTPSYYKLEGHFFSNRPSDRAQILHACADRDENGSHLKKIPPTPPQSNTKPIRIEGLSSDVRRTVVRSGQISYAHASLRSSMRRFVTCEESPLFCDNSALDHRHDKCFNFKLRRDDILEGRQQTTTVTQHKG